MGNFLKLLAVLSLIIVLMYGCDGFEDMNFLDTVPSVSQCEIKSVQPNSNSVKIPYVSAVTTTFGVVPNSDQCVVSYKLNGQTLPGNSAFISLSSVNMAEDSNQLEALASDGNTSASYVWTITKNTRPSCITQTPSTTGNTVNVDNSISLQATADNSDNDVLSFTWKLDGASAPALFNISNFSITSQASFVPTVSQVGDHTVSVEIYDGYDTATCNWSVFVNDSNYVHINSCIPDPVAVNPVVVTSTGSYSTRTFTISATGTGLTYEWLLDGTPISGANTSVLNLSAGPGFTAGDYVLTGIVRDAYANQDSCIFNVKRNEPPVLTVVTPSVATTHKMNVASTLNFQVSGTDANGDVIHYTWTMDGSINAHLPTGAATSSFNPASDVSLLGQHTIRVLASDNYETDQKEWSIKINYFSDYCNNLTSGKICTLVGSPTVGDGISVGVLENQNQSLIRIQPRMLAVDTVGVNKNIVFSDGISSSIWYYNRGSTETSRYGVTIPAYSLKAIAGVGQAGYYIVQPDIKLSTPMGIAINQDDVNNPKLYVADYGNHYVYEIDKDGNITTILGTGNNSVPDNTPAGADAQGTTISCYNPWGLDYLAGSNRLYVSCYGSNTIRYVNVSNSNFMTTQLVRSGGTTTNGSYGFSGTARTYAPRGLRVDSSSNVFWVETCQNTNNGGVVRVYSPAGDTFYGVVVAANDVQTVIGNADIGVNNCTTIKPTYPTLTGAWNSIRFYHPWDILLTGDGMWVSVDNSNLTTGNKIMFINKSAVTSVTYGNVTVPAAQGGWVVNSFTAPCYTFNGDGLTGTRTCTYAVSGLTYDGSRLFFGDYYLYRVRSLDLSIAAGTVKTHLGYGYGRSGLTGLTETPAQTVLLNSPQYMTIDDISSTLYVGDSGNNRILNVDLNTGVVATFLGRGSSPPSVDNVDRALPTALPSGITIYEGNLLYGNYGNGIYNPTTGGNRACIIRVINTGSSVQTLFNKLVDSNAVYTIAGSYGLGCLNNNNAALTYPIDATSKELYDIESMTVGEDLLGNSLVYFTTWPNHCVMKLDTNGNMGVALGNCSTAGNASTADVTTPAASFLRYPKGIKADPLNPVNLFIIDQTNQATQQIRYANFKDTSVSVFGVSVNPGKIQTILSVAGTPYISDIAIFDEQVCYATGYFSNANAGNHNVICKDRTQPGASVETLRCGAPDASPIRGAGPLNYSQEGINCSSAWLSAPSGLSFDSDGNLYISDRMNHIIRFVRRWF